MIKKLLRETFISVSINCKLKLLKQTKYFWHHLFVEILKSILTWDVFSELDQDLNLAGCHLGQKEEVLLCAELFLELLKKKKKKKSLKTLKQITTVDVLGR